MLGGRACIEDCSKAMSLLQAAQNAQDGQPLSSREAMQLKAVLGMKASAERQLTEPALQGEISQVRTECICWEPLLGLQGMLK